MSRSIPPNENELEISIIGPGRGESIVIHLGQNDWVIVDSCVARGSGEPAAFQYLQELKSNALSGIRLVVATHWHDDHIRGLASILRACPDARFCCSTAFQSAEFQQLIASAAESFPSRVGVEELYEVSKALRDRRDLGASNWTPQFGIENRSLLSLDHRSRPFPARVTALSPSDETVTLALAALREILPKAGEPQRRIINRSPNHASVVLWITAGSLRVLLGADLEHTNREGQGWTAILANVQDASRASLIKVPHHGSENADCPEVWDKMLHENPIAVITPFTAGVRLPKNTDLERIAARTSRLYLTSAGGGKPPSRPTAVERAIKQVLSNRRILAGQPGHVRVRWSANTENLPPRIEVFNGAMHIQST